MRDFKSWLRYWTYRSNWPYEVGKRRERAVMWLVWHIPSLVVEWCMVRVWAHGTTGHFGNTIASELTVFEAARRWESPLGGDRKRRHELYRTHRETPVEP